MLRHRKIFKPLHPPDALDILEPYQHLGPVDPLTVPAPEHTEPTEEEKRIEAAREKLPPVDSMLLLEDFENWAEQVLSGTAWNYYKSAGELDRGLMSETPADGQPIERSVCLSNLA